MYDTVYAFVHVLDTTTNEANYFEVAGYYDGQDTQVSEFYFDTNNTNISGGYIGSVGNNPGASNPYVAAALQFNSVSTGPVTKFSLWIGEPAPDTNNDADSVLLQIVKGDSDDLRNLTGTTVLSQVVDLSEESTNLWKDITIT